MIVILKLVIFYGGALAALVATIFLWFFWRPELHVQAFCDDSAQTIRCMLRTTHTLSPIRLTGIWIPVEYVEALGASPPHGFQEKFDRITPDWLYDNAKREIVIWNGRLEVPKGQSVHISIPARRPNAIGGTLRLTYEYRGVGGVLIGSESVHAPLNRNDA